MKLLENYVVTDRRGYDIAAKKCNQWLDEGVADVAEATIELLKGGAMVGLELRRGLFVLANMTNKDRSLNGEVWVTGNIETIIHDRRGLEIETHSGSVYRLGNQLPVERLFSASNGSSSSDEDASAPNAEVPSDDGVDVDEVFKDPLRFVVLLVPGLQ